jgi:hypothetical protein
MFVSMSLLALGAGCGEDTASDTQGAGGSAPELDANVGGAVLPPVGGQPGGGTPPVGGTDLPPEGGSPVPVPTGVGRCDYTNPFGQSVECKAYTGPGWTPETAAADCAAVLPGTAGVFSAEGACGFPVELGRCAVTMPAETAYELVMSGTTPENDAGCALARTGCETFARGVFTPSGPCAGGDPGPTPPSGPPQAGVFIPPYETCKPPVEGEPPGRAPNGDVCTFNAISACTEPGRRFEDYASCDVVRSQRPYYPVPPRAVAPENDPRLSDPTYLAEMGWVTEQAAACGCTCCHSQRASTAGASIWSIDESPLWLDHLSDGGLALLAGLADSSVLGAYPAEENYGFGRDETGLPSTDPARMQAFLLGEWMRRGRTPADAAEIPPFGGPIYSQQVYVPEPCRAGEGVGADGTVTWTNGEARYVYVLEAGSKNPGVPPNLDLPEGTVWRVDVTPDQRAVASGFAYGDVPAGAVQRFPAEGRPAALVSGETYYLYVLFDVGLPITRCLFEAP